MMVSLGGGGVLGHENDFLSRFKRFRMLLKMTMLVTGQVLKLQHSLPYLI